MKLRRHVALVGLPCAGKTSVGRALAAPLDCGVTHYAQAHVRVAAVTSAEMIEKILSLLDQSDMAAVSASR